MDIADLKKQAHALEQQGDAAGALATYRKILDEIEGTRAILSELPLYVKVGDLLLKQRHAKDAVAMYDRAARLYAQHGSSKSVLALCDRILTVSPRATSVYPRYAGLMVRTGHVSDAVNVLKSYAEVAGLPKVVEALEPFTDRTDDDVKHAVEILIEVLEQNEQLKRELAAQAEQLRVAEEARAAAPPEPAAAHHEPAPATPELEEPHADEADSEELTFLRGELESEELEEPDAAAAKESEPLVIHGSDNIFVDEPEPAVVHGYEPVPPEEPESEEEAEPDLSAADESASTAAAPADAEDPAYKEYAPDSWPRQEEGAKPATKGKSRSKLAWLALILIVVVGGGAGLVYFEVIPPDMLGLGGVFAPADVSTSPGPAIPAADSSTQAPADTPTETQPTPEPPRQTTTTTAAARTTAPPPDTAATEAAARDTTPVAAPPESPTVAADTAQAAAVPVTQPPIIVVDGLRVVSVDPYSSGGLTGFTIVQLLDTGERLTLTVLPASDAPAAFGVSDVIVTSVLPDSATGTARLGQYAVTAGARVSATVLDGLLRRLVEQ